MNIYQTEKVSDSLWLIREHYAEDSALVLGLIIGEEKAALIDSGMGLFGAELRELVNSLTDKPIVNILTHGHPDHIFGNVYFDGALLHPADLPLADMFAREPEFRPTRLPQLAPFAWTGRVPVIRQRRMEPSLMPAIVPMFLASALGAKVTRSRYRLWILPRLMPAKP